MVIETRGPATSDDLRQLASLPEHRDKWFELINGVIYEVLMPSSLHAFVALLIAARLLDFVLRHELGYVLGDGCVYRLPNGDELIPDASFVAKGRAHPVPAARLELAPDLVLEVASPGNTHTALMDKMTIYLENGTRLGWLVYPDKQIVFVYMPNTDGSMTLRKLGIDDALDGGEVLPGFTLPLRDVFI